MATWADLLLLKRPWVVAHRGFAARYPENTLAAFEAAVEAGADAIEFDVALTLDRVPVVLHDDTLQRTTSGRGLVSYTPAAALRELDAGSWFDSRFASERVPTLEEVFERLGGRTVFFIELRAAAFEVGLRGEPLELLVVDLVERFGLASSVLLASFEPRFFVRVNRRTKSIPLVLMCDQGPCEVDALAACKRYGAMALSPDVDQVNQREVLRFRVNGLRVFPWTVNDEEQMRRLVAWGVDGIITDDPSLLSQLVKGPPAPSGLT